MKKKQITGKPGRPKEVDIHGTKRERIEVTRLSANKGSANAEGVKRISGKGSGGGIEVVRPGDKTMGHSPKTK